MKKKRLFIAFSPQVNQLRERMWLLLNDALRKSAMCERLWRSLQERPPSILPC